MPRGKGGPRRTIESLRLDIDAAMTGRTWLLLPEGFRAQECGSTYPLPSYRAELQRIVNIALPTQKQDSGCIYIRRAMKAWKQRNRTGLRSDTLHTESAKHRVTDKVRNLDRTIREAKEDMKQAVDGIRQEAEKATASLKDLFALGRQGLKGQMEAHLAKEEWQGESISAKAFRDCYSMVSATVKALGIPSDQKKHAIEAIRAEVAESIRSTGDSLKLAPGNDEDTEH